MILEKDLAYLGDRDVKFLNRKFPSFLTQLKDDNVLVQVFDKVQVQGVLVMSR